MLAVDFMAPRLRPDSVRRALEEILGTSLAGPAYACLERVSVVAHHELRTAKPATVAETAREFWGRFASELHLVPNDRPELLDALIIECVGPWFEVPRSGRVNVVRLARTLVGAASSHLLEQTVRRLVTKKRDAHFVLNIATEELDRLHDNERSILELERRTANKLQNFSRDTREHMRSLKEWALVQPADDDPLPALHVARLVEQYVIPAFDRLPQPDKSVPLLRGRANGYSFKELASELGITEVNARQLHSRSVKRLKLEIAVAMRSSRAATRDLDAFLRDLEEIGEVDLANAVREL